MNGLPWTAALANTRAHPQDPGRRGRRAAALLGVAIFVLARYLESEAFRRAAVGAAQETLGASVTVGEMHVSLFSGATFRQVVVGNPPGLTGELLRADALVVRPRLLPLLRRRLEIAELRLDGARHHADPQRPGRVELRAPGLAARTRAAASRGRSRPAGRKPPPPMPVAPALDVVVPRLALSRGTLAVTRESKGALVGASGIQVTTSLSRVGGALAGQGELAVESLRIAERVEVRALTAPIRFSGGELTLSPIQGQLAEGALGGQVTVNLAGATRYAIAIDLKDAPRGAPWPRSAGAA